MAHARLIITLTLFTLGWYAPGVSAFNMKTTGFDLQMMVMPTKHRSFLDKFSHPVHEEITLRIFGCDADCTNSSPPSELSDVFHGVQWPDNPPFKLKQSHVCPTGVTLQMPHHPLCMALLFADSRAKALSDKPLPSFFGRVHFGDLSYFHAMASPPQKVRGTLVPETAAQTRQRVLTWIELLYRLSIGDAALPLWQTVGTLPVANVRALHLSPHTMMTLLGWDRKRADKHDPAYAARVRERAFGVMLHTLEDSFAPCHAIRDGAPLDIRPISAFGLYRDQDSLLHSGQDKRPSELDHLPPGDSHLIALGRTIVKARAAALPWKELRTTIEGALTISDPGALPTDGANRKCRATPWGENGT